MSPKKLWPLDVKTMLKDLIDMTIRKMDHDHDGKISFSDFSMTVLKEPLLMEAFGTCLPTSQAGVKFIMSVLDKRPNSLLYQA